MKKSIIGLFLILFIPSLIFSQEKIKDWLVFNTSNSALPSNNIRDIQVDRHGELWIGTWGGGLARLDMKRWIIYNGATSGLRGDNINQIAIDDKRDLIWMTTYEQGIACFNGKSWRNVSFPDGVKTQTIAVNDKGVVLIGTEQHGLYQYVLKDTLLSRVWGEDNNIDYGVMGISFDKSGYALVGTRQGLLRFYRDPTGIFSAVNTTLRKSPTSKIMVTREDHIWAINAQNNHLMYYNGKKWRELKNTTRLVYNSMNEEEATYYANELALTDDNRILIGTKYHGGLGITHYKTWGGIYTPYSGNSSMIGSIEAVALDKREGLWVGTWHKGLMTQIGYGILLDTIGGIDTVRSGIDEPASPEMIAKVERLSKRRAPLKDTVNCRTEIVEISIWDQQKEDNDTITLLLNGKIILDKHRLAKSPTKIKVRLKPNNNKLIMYAHNLGDIPPNTAQISVLELGRQKELTLMSDLGRSHAVNLIYSNELIKLKDPEENPKKKKRKGK